MTTDLRPPNAPAQALFGNRFLTEPAPSTHFPQGARRGRFGGWAGYVCDGRVKFIYHVLGIHEFTTMAEAPIPEGTRQVRIKFAYDGGGLANEGDVTLYSLGGLVCREHHRLGATRPWPTRAPSSAMSPA